MVNDRRNPADAPYTYQKLDVRAEPPGGPVKQIPSPGGTFSPQQPGEVPDRSSVPGQYAECSPRPAEIRRPLNERGTAQGIMRWFQAPAGSELDPSRFEQVTASWEELRKAYPPQLPPNRPAPGFPLDAHEEFGGPPEQIVAPEAGALQPGPSGGQQRGPGHLPPEAVQ